LRTLWILVFFTNWAEQESFLSGQETFLFGQEKKVGANVPSGLPYISVHGTAIALGPQHSLALPFFHAFTGCDTVSAFVGRGKKTCWEVWMKNPFITPSFIEFFHSPEIVSDACLAALQRFVVLLYDATCPCDSVNAARKKLFASKGKPVEHIPPNS
jgi:hypothetical protein